MSFYLLFVMRKPPAPVLYRTITWILKTILLGDHSIDHILYDLGRILLELYHSVSQLPVKFSAAFICTLQAVDHVKLSFTADLFLPPQNSIPVFQDALAFRTDTDFITLYIKTCSSSLYSSV